jgi:hypothetical protein
MLSVSNSRWYRHATEAQLRRFTPKRSAAKGLFCGSVLRLILRDGTKIYGNDSEVGVVQEKFLVESQQLTQATLIPAAQDIVSMELDEAISWILVIEKEVVEFTLSWLLETYFLGCVPNTLSRRLYQPFYFTWARNCYHSWVHTGLLRQDLNVKERAEDIQISQQGNLFITFQKAFQAGALLWIVLIVFSKCNQYPLSRTHGCRSSRTGYSVGLQVR